ncbi:Methylthioadenosine phosphorylase [Nadsonia fulvescens var. elongata DSM 6958]|uniref:S-methyl-5'-thioadenosine phosphorylase n=1 Tax=Nadsonia fulvescens var. elongata DSM 6958 TaxID=857566 RepID=A0A1E3PLV6_9ASCO|nr:Methylthioadenosine phosphorylase [Nadsonia fulvescens var. elongata DSM 6958]
MSLPTTFDEPILLGVIGGTGLYKLSCLTPVAKLTVQTPWGLPSSPITISRTPSGFPVAFLARHGIHHDLTPSDVPARANIAALKSLGVRAIVAFSAVGSLQEEIAPRDFVIPNQIIDRTKGVRPSSFFEKGFVGHVGFGDPFDAALSEVLAENSDVLLGQKLHSKRSASDKDLVLICMEGPAFSTRAESKLYRSWGGSVINMSALPEAKLAKEAEISYQMICMSTDYDAWKEDEEPVTVEQVVGNLTANAANAERVISAILEPVELAIMEKRVGYTLEGSMRYAISTGPASRNKQMAANLDFLHTGYWS